MRGNEYRIMLGTDLDKHGCAIPANWKADYLDATYRQLAQQFGGFTAYYHVGGWYNGEGKLILENGVTFSICVPNGTALTKIKSAADEIRNRFEQQSVVLIHPGGISEFIAD